MADIELLIKIEEDTYKDIKKGKVYSSIRDVPQESVSAIANGTPLPKGHGDLIDRDKVSSKLISLIRKFYEMFPTKRLHSDIDRAKINELRYCISALSEESAIIEADKTESEE